MYKILIAVALLCVVAHANEEEQILSKICKWNDCFKSCMANQTYTTRAGCKTSCKCWFLAAVDE